MDREKLNKAAGEDWCNNVLERDLKPITKSAFKRGAYWLMQQPLSERLTDEEKEKINKLQGEILKETMDAHDADDWQSVAHYILDVMPRTFASIFGADLFKEK